MMSKYPEDSKKAKRNAVVFERDKDEEDKDRAKIMETLVKTLFRTILVSPYVKEISYFFEN